MTSGHRHCSTKDTIKHSAGNNHCQLVKDNLRLLSVIKVPKNIDFDFNALIDEFQL